MFVSVLQFTVECQFELVLLEGTRLPGTDISVSFVLYSVFAEEEPSGCINLLIYIFNCTH